VSPWAFLPSHLHQPRGSVHLLGSHLVVFKLPVGAAIWSGPQNRGHAWQTQNSNGQDSCQRVVRRDNSHHGPGVGPTSAHGSSASWAGYKVSAFTARLCAGGFNGRPCVGGVQGDSADGPSSRGKDEGSRMVGDAVLDVSRDRFPYCIVWTPIPCLTWIFPFIGHMVGCPVRL
jgi:hypothetical protein